MWYFFPTFRCNLDCKMCFARPDTQIQRRELTYSEYERTVDFLIGAGYSEFELAGGEPLLRKDIWKICEYIHEKGGDLNLSTNGTLIQPFLSVFEQNYFQNIEISLDGPSASIHNSIRRTPVFEKTLDGIRALAELKKKEKADFSLGISTMLLQDNVRSLDKLVEVVSDIADYICIQTLDIVGNGVQQMKNHVMPSDYLHLIIRLLQSMQTMSDVVLRRITLLYPACFSPFIQSAIPFQRFAIGDVKLDVVTHDCNMFTGYQALTPSGEVTGCCLMVGSEKFCGKNIIELSEKGKSTLHEELTKKRTTLYERIILDNDFACNTCTFFHVCKGGCRASAYSYYKDIMAPDPRCLLRGELQEQESEIIHAAKKTRDSLRILVIDEDVSTSGICSIDATRD